MTPVAISCDEDVHAAVCRGLRRLGIDATSAAREGRLGAGDKEQLLWAIAANRCLLTHNIHDFPRIHAEFLQRSARHAGIIVARQDLSIGEMIRRVARLTTTLSAEDMKDRLEFLGAW